MPVTRRRGDLRGEERHVRADRGQLLQRRRHPGSSDAPSERRPRRQAAAASDEPPPSPAATGIRFSRVRHTRSGARPIAGQQAAPGQVLRAERQRLAALALHPQPRAAGQQQQPIGQLQQDELAVELVEAVRRVVRSPPATGSAWPGASSRSGVTPHPPAAGPSSARRQAHCVHGERLRALLRLDPAGRKGRGQHLRGPHRSSRDEGVVQLLAPLPEAGLHQPVERLAPAARRHHRVRCGGAGAGPPSRRSGAGSKAAAGTRVTTSASATFCAKTDR